MKGHERRMKEMQKAQWSSHGVQRWTHAYPTTYLPTYLPTLVLPLSSKHSTTDCRRRHCCCSCKCCTALAGARPPPHVAELASHSDTQSDATLMQLQDVHAATVPQYEINYLSTYLSKIPTCTWVYLTLMTLATLMCNFDHFHGFDDFSPKIF